MFSQKLLEEAMHKITLEKGIIPSVLYAEMALFADVIMVTKATEIFPANETQYKSNLYPGLIIKLWNKPGWKLE